MRGFMGVLCNNMAKEGSGTCLSRFPVKDLTIISKVKTIKTT